MDKDLGCGGAPALREEELLPAIRWMAEQIPGGFFVYRAENGRIALDMFRGSGENHYDAVLMDIRMPEMDGLAAAKAIRALDRRDAKAIPIIAMTANAFDEDVQLSLQAGMNAHLSNPVEPAQMYQMLEELIYESGEEQ